MNFFEKLLEEKSKLNNSYDYFTQWEYDKKLYQDILLGVRDYYSSYTDHGCNHSETILTNILRMFGEEEIKSLSSFDIWLLLESAYLHDCGMYVSREEAEKTLNDINFISYLKKVCETYSHPMNKFVKSFKIENNKIFYNNLEYTVDIEYKMRFLISSYKRASHAQDFKNVVFYKDKLLPDRIYHILSIISEAHGETFENMMKLPKKENGIGKEMGHPLFIACLLRMGDLLDIDNNRISPMIKKNIYEIIPEDSKLHLEKHSSINHLWIDKEKIEVLAHINCGEKSYDVAEITGDWFEYIREEYNNQLYNWTLIIPDNFKGTLPRLGELKIEIENYEYIDTEHKPKFSVDTNNILELLVGTSIYDRNENAVREILQNSMDATYLRIFEENKEEILNKKSFSLKEIKKLFKEKEIEVNIKTLKEKSDKDPNYNYWNISIKDRGIGIDKERLKFLIEAGSSYKDKNKLIQINDMPNWLKPSGNFGIGFQSIFLLTDRVRIQSKSLYNQNSIDVELLKPSVKKAGMGNIYFRKTKFDYKQEIGTIISFEYKTEKVSSSYSYNGKYLTSYIKNFDPLVDKEFDTKIYRFIDEINSINEYSFIDIKLLKDNNYIELISKSQEFENQKIKSEDKYQVYFYKNTENFNNSQKYFYKNQPVTKNSPNIEYFYGIVNILGYSAKEVLHLNRNEIQKEFLSSKSDEILKNIYINMEEIYLKTFETLEVFTKKHICYFYFFYENVLKSLFHNNIDIISNYHEVLKNFYYNIDFGNSLTINTLKLENKIKICIKNNKKFAQYFLNTFEIQKNFLDLILIELFKINKYEISFNESEEDLEISLLKKEDSFNTINYEYKLKKVFFNSFFVRKRFYIFCNKHSINLRLKKKLDQTEVLSWIGYLELFPEYNSLIIYNLILKENFILFPFYLKNENTMVWNEEIKENYIKNCYEYRFDKNLTLENFVSSLDNFVEYLKEELKKIGVEVKVN